VVLSVVKIHVNEPRILQVLPVAVKRRYGLRRQR
jgi:hypothetical protein